MARDDLAEKATLCAVNNAEWCDVVCRAHGVPGSFGPAIWTQERVGPPYYSNAITLSPFEQDLQRGAIGELCRVLPDGFSVKDSFGCLDLSDAGFRRLFCAEWVWLDPARRLGSTIASEWIRVTHECELDRWEAAWRAAGSPTRTRVFPRSLLLDEKVAFLGAERDNAFVAGCVANRSTGNVVGFSNFFAVGDYHSHLSSAVREMCLFSDVPIVGYDQGEALAGLHALGFRSVGRLRVWIREKDMGTHA